MRVATFEDAVPLLAPFFADGRVERVVVMHLTGAREVIGLTLEQTGGHGEVALPVGGILASALRLGAAAVIVAHNHPSGDPEPSLPDKEATRGLADAMRPLGLRLTDHIVFARGGCRSFAALGLL
jgi:DNA repair protein RadC